MKEVLDFIEKLKEERNNINQKLRFVSEQKFEREADFLREKINTINSIVFELGINYTYRINKAIAWKIKEQNRNGK